MQGQFLVNSRSSCEEMKIIVERCFREGKHVRFAWEAGIPVKQEQLALFHIWLRRWFGHVYHRADHTITKGDVEKMKRDVKDLMYRETGFSWLVRTIDDPLAPNGKKTAFVSAGQWSQSECFQVLEWMQERAARGGLILESTGEHDSLKKGSYR